MYLYRLMASAVQRFLHKVYVAYAFLAFILLMMVVLPLVVVLSFFRTLQAGNLIFRLCNFWADSWFFLAGIRTRCRYEGEYDSDKHFIYIANHISYLDAAVIAKIMRKPIRVLARVESSRIPFFGFIYRNATVTVDRSNAENRLRSVEMLKSILRKEISIFIFPEGTFNMTGRPLKDFYDGAFRIALETQTPIKPILILDSYDRMHYDSLFSLNPGLNRCVFLDTVPVDGYAKEDVAKLKEAVYSIMEQKLTELKPGWIRPSTINSDN